MALADLLQIQNLFQLPNFSHNIIALFRILIQAEIHHIYHFIILLIQIFQIQFHFSKVSHLKNLLFLLVIWIQKLNLIIQIYKVTLLEYLSFLIFIFHFNQLILNMDHWKQSLGDEAAFKYFTVAVSSYWVVCYVNMLILINHYENGFVFNLVHDEVLVKNKKYLFWKWNIFMIIQYWVFYVTQFHNLVALSLFFFYVFLRK